MLYLRSMTIGGKTKHYHFRNGFGLISNMPKLVAELILTNVDTKIYYISLPGFDTHVNQQHQHERLLTAYAEGIHAVIKEHRNWDVLIMTFFEFGRRGKQNAGGGRIMELLTMYFRYRDG